MNNWQKHWSNSSNDPRMQLLIGEMGPKGYGIYWLISERIHATGHDCALQKDIVRNIRSRRLNRQYIEQVINKYYLFLMNTEGFVVHHPVPLGHMSAHLLHDLMHGKAELPAQYTSCSQPGNQPTAMVGTKNGSNGDRLHPYYNARAGENKNISCIKNNKGFEEIINGVRYADGKPIPGEAPPRPSSTAVWDTGAHLWLEL